MKKSTVSKQQRQAYAMIDRAMKRAALRARAVARIYGTPIYVWENGKVVAKRP